MKKKVMLIDPLSPWGHFDINKIMVSVLKDEFEIHYVASRNFVNKFEKEINVYGVDEEYFKIGNNSLKNRYNLYKAFGEMMKHVDSISPDYIIILSFDIIVQSVWLMLNQSKISKWSNKIRYLCHSSIDELESSFIKRAFFSIGMKKCKYLVYEQYINSFFTDKYGVDSRVLHHTINEYKLTYDEKKVSLPLIKFINEEMINIIAPSSNGIENSVIEELIKLDKNGYLSDHRVKFFLKSKTKKYKSENLWISGEYLSDDDYSFLFGAADYVYLPYDTNTYNYRVSGVYFDSVTFLKPIIYSPIMFFIDQENRFGDIGVRAGKTMKDTIDQCTKERSLICKKVVKNVKHYYSNKNLLRELNDII